MNISSSSVGSNATDSNLYGTNAAVLAYGPVAASGVSATGGTITVTNGSIYTTGEYGAGVFASGTGSTVNLSGTSIMTTGTNARGASAAEGGTLTLSDVTATTSGSGSPALATDQGGATVNVTNGGTYTAQNAEAVVVEGNSTVTLTGAALTSKLGSYRGILLYQDTMSGDATNVTSVFSMTGGSISYSCDATSTTACTTGVISSGQSYPATVFAVANTTATITLTDLTSVTNDTATSSSGSGSYGTLLAAMALNSGTWGASGTNGGKVTFTAKGTTLTGDVVVDANSTAQLSILEDSNSKGSSLTGAINSKNSGSTTVSLTLDSVSIWTVTAGSYVTSLSGLNLSGTTVDNIDGGGFCIYYSGTVNGASGTTYTLAGTKGGYLAPAGSTGLSCN
jgi:hypothetical protein